MLRRVQRPRRGERGFTLIELLVVIIILGLLAGVVVFAVRGTGDKGKAASVATDERIIRTAQEAYCGQKGRYASGQELVDGKFLSELPQYHQVTASQPGGPCNGWKFTILRTAQADPYPPGRWDVLTPGPALGSTQFLVRLPDGKVLAGGGFNTTINGPAAQVWDPSTGVWTFTDTPTIGTGHTVSNNAMVLTDDPTTPQSECKGAVDNCGKVLVHGRHLFDPKVAPGTTGQWATIPNPGSSCNICTNGSANFNYVQPMNSVGPCGTACGKVYIFAGSGTGELNFDSFDPRDNSYSVVPLAADGISSSVAKSSPGIQLADGRIFFCCHSAPSVTKATFFDPVNLTFTSDDTARPPAPGGAYQRSSDPMPAPILPGGALFFGNDGSNVFPHSAGVYTQQSGGPGTWKRVADCNPPGGDGSACRILGSLLDGRVLAIRNSSSSTLSSAHDVWVYNPGSETWTPSPKLKDRFSFGFDAVLLDPAGGPCGPHCGKMLVANRGRAEVYSP